MKKNLLYITKIERCAARHLRRAHIAGDTAIVRDPMPWRDMGLCGLASMESETEEDEGVTTVSTTLTARLRTSTPPTKTKPNTTTKISSGSPSTNPTSPSPSASKTPANATSSTTTDYYEAPYTSPSRSLEIRHNPSNSTYTSDQKNPDTSTRSAMTHNSQKSSITAGSKSSQNPWRGFSTNSILSPATGEQKTA